MLKVGAALNDRSGPLLQLALHPLEEWGAGLHMQVLSQSYSFDHVAQLGVPFHNFANLVPRTSVSAAQCLGLTRSWRRALNFVGSRKRIGWRLQLRRRVLRDVGKIGRQRRRANGRWPWLVWFGHRVPPSNREPTAD